MINPVFSIIIPTYNRGHCISDCINSVLSQTFEDFEIIVVDDGSTDGTREIVNSIDDRRLKYLYKDNGGVSAARNFGLTRSRGTWICLLDSDDEFEPTKLEEYYKHLDENCVLVSNATIDDSSSRRDFFEIRGNNLSEPVVKIEYPLYHVIYNNYCAPTYCFHRSNVFDKNIRFMTDISMYEDHHFLLLLCLSSSLIVIDKPLTNVHVKGDFSDSLSYFHEQVLGGCDTIKIRIYRDIMSNENVNLVSKILLCNRIARIYQKIANENSDILLDFYLNLLRSIYYCRSIKLLFKSVVMGLLGKRSKSIFEVKNNYRRSDFYEHK